MKTETDFNKLIASIPDERLRRNIKTNAWQNSFAVEVYDEYANDAERWDVAWGTAEMMIDAPSDYDLDY